VRLYHAGDRGEPVRDIQRRLNDLGFSVTPDGIYGLETKDIVGRFQKSRGLPSDGIVGPETWRSLVDAGFKLGDRLLYRRSPMMRGDDVSRLQQSLGSLGFDAGKVDGLFGPDTLRAILDFQRNRGMPEDGIAGREVVDELALMSKATDKPAREVVREHAWVDSLPRPIAGARIYIDPEGTDRETADATWTIGTVVATALRFAGARALLSRSVDTAPSEHLRAQRANRLDVQVVVSIRIPADGIEGVFYFGTSLSTSAAGQAVAYHLAPCLGLDPLPRAVPILKETRSPAVVIALEHPSDEHGRAIAGALIDFYASGPNDH